RGAAHAVRHDAAREGRAVRVRRRDGRVQRVPRAPAARRARRHAALSADGDDGARVRGAGAGGDDDPRRVARAERDYVMTATAAGELRPLTETMAAAWAITVADG